MPLALATTARPTDPASPPGRAELLARHGPTVWALCRRLDPDPRDAYQEVWEKVFRGLPTFDPAGPATLRTWILAIAHRHLVDRSRRRRVRGDVLPDVDLADPTPGIEEAYAEGERAARLELAIARLPESARRAVVLHHLGEIPIEQVAAAEGVAVGTVKSRLHRARAILLAWMEGDR